MNFIILSLLERSLDLIGKSKLFDFLNTNCGNLKSANANCLRILLRKSVKKALLLFFVSIALITKINAQETEQEYPWLDSMHRSIASSVNSSALWFDDFFALEKFEKREEAYGEARIRLGWVPRSRNFNEFETRFKVRVKLPNLKNRVDLVLSDYEDDRAYNDLQSSGTDDFVEKNRLVWRCNGVEAPKVDCHTVSG